MNKKLILSLLVLATFFVSCKKEDPDVEKPSVTNYTINGDDHEAEVEAGSTMNVELSFTDNMNLKEYKLDIHDNFDLHSHGKTTANLPFEKLTIGGLEGTSDGASLSIDVGADVASGPYHADLSVLDAEGNQSDFSEIILHITRSDMAQVNLTSPSFDPEPSFSAGDTLTLTGEITDNVDIDEIIIVVAEAEEEHNHGKTGSGEIYEEDWDLTGAADTNWDFSTLAQEGKEIVFPSTVETGEYVLQIYVKDSDDNYNLWEAHFEVE